MPSSGVKNLARFRDQKKDTRSFLLPYTFKCVQIKKKKKKKKKEEEEKKRNRRKDGKKEGKMFFFNYVFSVNEEKMYFLVNHHPY